MLSGSNISLTLNENPILRDVNISLDFGKVATVIGPSGSGKTTLLRTLCLLEEPQQGTITINGSHYEFPKSGNNNHPTPWPDITFVFQELYLWPHLTLKENILLPYRVKNKKIPQAIDDEFNALVESLDLSQAVLRHPQEVSGGEKQRAAIARAILLHPRYLLLDEITSALDIEQVSSILSLIADLKKNDMSMLIVSHHIEFAKRVSDYIYFMDKGAIVEHGTPAILETPQSERLAEFLEFIRIAR